MAQSILLEILVTSVDLHIGLGNNLNPIPASISFLHSLKTLGGTEMEHSLKWVHIFWGYI